MDIMQYRRLRYTFITHPWHKFCYQVYDSIADELYTFRSRSQALRCYEARIYPRDVDYRHDLTVPHTGSLRYGKPSHERTVSVVIKRSPDFYDWIKHWRDKDIDDYSTEYITNEEVELGGEDISTGMNSGVNCSIRP